MKKLLFNYLIEDHGMLESVTVMTLVWIKIPFSYWMNGKPCDAKQ